LTAETQFSFAAAMFQQQQQHDTCRLEKLMRALTTRFGLSALACALGLGLSNVHAAEKWNMTVENPDGNSITIVAKAFAEQVAEATGNELQIRVHSNSVLFKRPEVKRAVQTGQVQLGEMLICTLGNEDPIFEIDS